MESALNLGVFESVTAEEFLKPHLLKPGAL